MFRFRGPVGLGREEGSALFAALVMILLLASMSAAYLSMSQSNYRAVSGRLDAVQALYAAESGIDAAMVELASGDDDDEDGLGAVVGSVGGGTYDVTVEWLDAQTARLVSVGVFGEYTRRMEAVVRKEVPPVFDYAIVTDGDLDFRGHVSITGGDIHSNGDIYIKGGSGTFGGDVSAAGTVSGKTSGVAGDVISGADPVPITRIPVEAFKDDAVSAGTYYSGNRAWSSGSGSIGDTVDGVIYVDGDLQLSGRIEGTGVIVVAGDLNIKGHVSYGTSDSSVIIIADGDVDIHGHPNIVGTIYTNGTVRLRGHVDIEGSLIAKSGFNSEGYSSIRGHVGVVYVPPDLSILDRFTAYEVVVRRELK